MVSPSPRTESETIISSEPAQPQAAPDFVGTWRLVSYQACDATGQVRYPMGEHVSGQLAYDAAGNMSAQVGRDDRPLFAAGDPLRGSDSELRAAFEGYTSYFGTYTIDANEQTVTHHVLGASYPNWVGSDQIRHYKFDGTRLSLSAGLVEDGQTFEFMLSWERIR